MQSIHRSCKAAAKEYGTNLAGGANIAAFLKVRWRAAEPCTSQRMSLYWTLFWIAHNGVF